jgi:uncharacterized membrane protein
LKHPLHPALAHVPMALWPVAFVFDLIYLISAGGGPAARSALLSTSFYAILLGLLVALLAIPAGLADWWDIKRTNPAWKIGLVHLIVNGIVTVFWAINLYGRAGPVFNGSDFPNGLVWLSGLATLLLVVSGYLGGRMVYDYGISVARQSKKKWRRIAEAGGANLPPAQ